MNNILRFVLGFVHTVIQAVRIDGEAIVLSVRPWSRYSCLCPVCGKKCNIYDRHTKPRRWRALDLARSKCFLEYAPCRVKCLEHGVHVESLPWARPRSRFTRDFEDWVACLTIRCTTTAVSELARVDWHTVGGICTRVFEELEKTRGKKRFDKIKRIGIDETSYKKGHKYLTVVVDHDRGCLIWAHEGCNKATLNLFFDELSREQRRGIEVVSADGAKWIKNLVKKRCPNARLVMDPFHVISWANDALDTVRCLEWQTAKAATKAITPKRKRAGRPAKGDETPQEAKALTAAAEAIKGSKYALLKNPDNLSDSQRKKLEQIKTKAGSHLFRAWELKEDLRAVFHSKDIDEAKRLLDKWLHDATYSKIEPIVEVEKKVRKRKEDILAAIELGIGNGRVEAINNKIKVTVKMGYGFRNTDNLVSLLMLRCSDIKPTLPGRESKKKEKGVVGVA